MMFIGLHLRIPVFCFPFYEKKNQNFSENFQTILLAATQVITSFKLLFLLLGQYLKSHHGAFRTPPIDLLIKIKVIANIKRNNFHYYGISIFGHQRELDL
jgi:hypothetical protein